VKKKFWNGLLSSYVYKGQQLINLMFHVMVMRLVRADYSGVGSRQFLPITRVFNWRNQLIFIDPRQQLMVQIHTF
jgi:hypothetical protein